MKLRIIGSGSLYDQAQRLAEAAGYELVNEGGDYILPATEDDGVLGSLGENALFDPAAWEIASSRLKTDETLRERGIPAPEYFPGGAEPYLVKPDRGSFGRGIWVTDDYCEVGGAVNAGFVTQEELQGDVWSAAAAGKPGAYAMYPPAKLTFDGRRQRVSAELMDPPDGQGLEDTVRACAEALGIRGVLEVEAIHHLGVWKVIDLNARLPMLTSDALLEQVLRVAGGEPVVSERNGYHDFAIFKQGVTL